MSPDVEDLRWSTEPTVQWLVREATTSFLLTGAVVVVLVSVARTAYRLVAS